MGPGIRKRLDGEDVRVMILPMHQPIMGQSATEQSAGAPQAVAPTFNASSAGILWEYTGILSCSLLMWVAYLVLPKGMRKAYCRSGRKRYTRRKVTGVAVSSAESLYSTLTDDDSLYSLDGQKMKGLSVQQEKMVQKLRSARESKLPTHRYEDVPRTPLQPQAASASHPAIDRVPDAKILNETMFRLKEKGMRLVAHGVQSDPKRVWIRYEESDDHYLCWQTEVPKLIRSQSGETSSVLTRGAEHRIPVANILYIDVGKKTAALQRTNAVIPAAACFSLLTQNGSLDLQTNSRLERDALVCSLSYVLDQVHSQDWRRLHEESPAPSEYMSSVNMSRISHISSNAFGDV